MDWLGASQTPNLDNAWEKGGAMHPDSNVDAVLGTPCHLLQAQSLSTLGAAVWDNISTSVKNGMKEGGQIDALGKWGVEPKDWYIPRVPYMKAYAAIYGYILKSACRHSLRPGFLHAVVFGEGLALVVRREYDNKSPFKPGMAIDSYNSLGLDTLSYDFQILVNGGYLDPDIKSNILGLDSEYTLKNETNDSVRQLAILGYETAIELVAAELEWRMDYMAGIAESHSLSTSSDAEREFLAYAKYVSKINAEKQLAEAPSIAYYTRKWSMEKDGPPPTNIFDKNFYRYQTLIRMSTAHWYAYAGLYSFQQLL